MRRCDESLKKTFELVNQMLLLAEIGNEYREDTGCGVLYSVIQDSAYKIKRLAETEKKAHVDKGWWQ